MTNTNNQQIATDHSTAVINKYKKKSSIVVVDILRAIIGLLGAISFEINYNWEMELNLRAAALDNWMIDKAK